MARLIYFCLKILPASSLPLSLSHEHTHTRAHAPTYQRVAEVVMLEAFGHHAIPR